MRVEALSIWLTHENYIPYTKMLTVPLRQREEEEKLW
jgi:hypothetical protein